MHVAILTYSPRPRGGVVHALRLAEALKDEEADVKLFSLMRHDLDSPREFYRWTKVPYEIFEFAWHEDIKERLHSMVQAFIDGLPKNYDVYHAQDCVCDTALQLLASEGSIDAPIVRTVHHVEGFSDQYLNGCEQNALRGNTAKITVSKYWQNELIDSYGIESTVIYNGIDSSKFEKPAGKREPFILFVGGMEHRKGLEYAIHALEMLRKHGSPLKLVAIARPGFRGIENRSWFEHLIERCNLAGTVEIHEQVSDAQLEGLYSKASVFLLPTRMEGWGLSLMEAMAAGCPVVTSPVGGIPELIEDGANGLLVPVGDVKGLAVAIERLASDIALREHIISNAKETLKKYTWKSAGEKTIALYDSLLRKK